MLSKEEYKKNLTRMFDSIRSEHKGEKNCDGVGCSECPFNNRGSCSMVESKFYLFETMEIVENWVKEHPVVTNTMKFKEVFNIPSDIELTCINMDKNCVKCVYYNDGECPVNNWWNSPYEEKKGK